MNPFSILGSKIFAGVSLALLLAVAVQSWRLDRTEGKLAKARTQIVELQTAHDAFIADGERRAEEGKANQKAAKPTLERIDRAKARIVPQVAGDCPTPPEVVEGVAEGWR